MGQIGRSALITGLILGTGVPAARAAPQAVPDTSTQEDTLVARDTLARADTFVADSLPPSDAAPPRRSLLRPDTLYLGPDRSAPAPAGRLDSLRQRTAELRAALTRLRVHHGVAVQRVVSGLRFLVPFSSADEDAVGSSETGPLEQIAALTQRYYPSASVYVRAVPPGHRTDCGEDEARRRARAAADRLTGEGGLPADRVRRAGCGADAPAAEVLGLPGDSPSTGVTVVVAWEARGDPF